MDEALVHFQKALVINPDYAEAHDNLGNALFQMGQADEALVHFQKALVINPDYAEAHNNLGEALRQKGQADEAMTHYQRALIINPDFAEAHYNLGNAFIQKSRVDEAMSHYRTALRLKPDFAEAHKDLGNAFIQKGQAREAVAHYEEAVRINPKNLIAHNDLAWILATSPEASLRNGARAVELARRASQISGDIHPALLQTLAAAYAETGRFAEADETAERALSLANAQGNGALAKVIRSGRIRYQAGKPVRDTGLAAEGTQPVVP